VTTLADLVVEVQRRTLSSLREETDQLGGDINSSAADIQLASGQTLGSIGPGAILQIDYELLLVTGAPAASAVPVQRGYYGSTPASHTANANIVVNPRFPAVDIIRAINEDIDDLSAPANGLFQAKEITLNYNPVLVGYDFTDANGGGQVTSANLIDLLEVRVHEYGPAQVWPPVPLSRVKVQRQADTTQFPSGMALQFRGCGFPGRPIRVQYMAPYTTPLAAAADDVAAVTGLHPQAHDIPTLGATYRLMQFREIPRSFTEAQPQPRKAQEVPVGSSLTAMKGVMQHRLDRIAAERGRLNRMYPRSWL
jgi:hypothetical protein